MRSVIGKARRSMWIFLLALGADCGSGPGRQAARAVPGQGFVPTSRAGYRMEARIGGERWMADRMRRRETGTRFLRVEGLGAGKRIRFGLWIPELRTGDSLPLDREQAAELTSAAGDTVWRGLTGSVRILRIDPLVIEGSFRFTAVSEWPDSTVEVAGGYFRVPLQAGGGAPLTGPAPVSRGRSPREAPRTARAR